MLTLIRCISRKKLKNAHQFLKLRLLSLSEDRAIQGRIQNVLLS